MSLFPANLQLGRLIAPPPRGSTQIGAMNISSILARHGRLLCLELAVVHDDGKVQQML